MDRMTEESHESFYFNKTKESISDIVKQTEQDAQSKIQHLSDEGSILYRIVFPCKFWHW